MVTGDRQTGRIEDAPPEQQGLLSSGQQQPVAAPRAAPAPKAQKKTVTKTMPRLKAKGTPKNRNGVMCLIMLLDGKEAEIEVDKSAKGLVLIEAAYKHVQLAEKDYFSLTYYDKDNLKAWLNPDKTIEKQLKGVPWTFVFETKFYPTDPKLLHEDLTRYFLCLQLRTDLLKGKLPCSFVTHAVLGSYAVQSDLGDFDVEDHGEGFEYIKDMRFMPNQGQELLEEIAAIHRQQKGQSPADAESNYLDNAKNIALYGVHMHNARDREGEVQIGVCAHGILIYRNGLRVNRFTWPKIMKISYKKNTFTVRIRPEEHETREGVIVYTLISYTVAKRLWKLAVEHHAFFRLKEAEMAERTKFAPFGSKFRYSGRTQYQSAGADYGRKKGPTVDRSESHKKFTRRDRDSPYGTLEKGMSTDRKEDKIIVVEGGAATLTLPNRKKGGSQENLNYGAANNNRSLSHETDDDDGNLALLSGGGASDFTGAKFSRNAYGTGSQPGYDQYGTNRSTGAGGGMYDPYGTNRSQGGGAGGAYDPYGTNRSQGHGGDVSYGDGMGDGSGGFGPDGRPLRGSRGNVMMTNGGGSGSRNNLPTSGEDQRYEHSIDGVSGQGRWGANVISTTTKTTTKTYTNPDGSICTEHKTEKQGVIETKIERKTLVTSGQDFDEFDHDKALRDAILAVTDVNTDLSVEKIEIQTKSETK